MHASMHRYIDNIPPSSILYIHMYTNCIYIFMYNINVFHHVFIMYLYLHTPV